jgi:hypothetical protein
LRKQNKGIDSPNTIFGAVAPDINQVLSTDQNSPFFTTTHYGFMDVWEATTVVTTPTAKPLAFGFVSHNKLWGADHYAHITSNLYPNYINPDPRYSGQNGYVWVKAAQLCSLMQTQLQQSGQGGGSRSGPPQRPRELPLHRGICHGHRAEDHARYEDWGASHSGVV